MSKIEKLMGGYRSFLDGVDRDGERLSKLHASHMVCGRGCSSCCQSLTLLPIEAYALTRGRMALGIQDNQPGAGSCPFLKNNLCTVYAFRPLICRTHGLPLLYLDDYGESWQLSLCELNFTGLEEEDYADYFTPGDLMNMEERNAVLNRLNRDFLETDEGHCYTRGERVSMESLFQ